MFRLIMKLVCLFFCLFLILSFVFAEENPFLLRGIRPLGMGGAGIAFLSDNNSFFYNPATSTERKKMLLTVFEIRGGISKDVIEFSDWINKNQDDLKKFDSLSQSKKDKIFSEITNKITNYNNQILFSAPNLNYISGPINGNTYIGIGFFDQADFRVKMNSGVLVPNLDIYGNVDASVILLLAHKFTDNFSIGMNAKYLNRGSIVEERLSVLAVDGFKPVIQIGSGLGFDLGVLYKLNRKVNLGLSVTDVGSTRLKYPKVDSKLESDGTITQGRVEKTDSIYSRINLGVSYKPFKRYFNRSFCPDVTLLADVFDVTNQDRNENFVDFSEFLTKTHFGIEFAWKFLALRAGLNSGYPTAGIGLSLWCLKLDYAYYTDEMGMFPGYKPISNHTLALSLRFGTTVSKKLKK